MPALPTAFQWTGYVMEPTHWKLASTRFSVGQTYLLVEEQERSRASHNHEFAFLNEAFKSFPDELVITYPTPEHLRKHGLIRKGFCNIQDHVCETKAEAQRLRAILSGRDEYAVVIVIGNGLVVREMTAKSQSIKSMGKAEFQASKTALMEFVADLLGVAPGELPSRESA
jgi:hypothetical protein